MSARQPLSQGHASSAAAGESVATWATRPDGVARRNDEVTWSRLHGEVVLLDPAGARLCGLNGTAGRVWELLDGRATVRDVAAAIAREFQVDEARSFDDVVRFLDLLAARALVQNSIQPTGGRR